MPAAAFALFGPIRQELTPTEDRSVVLLRINAPQGVSLDYTTQQMRRIEQLIQPLRDSGEIDSTFANAGQGGSVQQRLHGDVAGAVGRARALASRRSSPRSASSCGRCRACASSRSQPNSLGIRGAGNGLQFALVGNNYAELGDAADKIVAEMEKDPRFQQPRLSIDATQPQLAVAIDRERASDLGIDITGLAASAAGDARRQRDRRRLHRRPQPTR